MNLSNDSRLTKACLWILKNESACYMVGVFFAILSLKHFSGEEGTQNDDFKEPWANGFPDPRAYGLWFDLYYQGERLKRVLLVAVDGCKAYLPCPEPMSKAVTPLSASIATIVNYDGQLYEQYFKRAYLQHEDAKQTRD